MLPASTTWSQKSNPVAPWTDSSVNDSKNLLLKLDKLGFEPSKQERQELPGTIFSVYDTYILLLNLDKLGFQPSKQERLELPRLIFQSAKVKF